MTTQQKRRMTPAQSLILSTSLLALMTACSTESPTASTTGTTTNPTATSTTQNTAGATGDATVIPQTNSTSDNGSVLPAMSTGGLFGGSNGAGSTTGTNSGTSGGSTPGLGGSTGGSGGSPVSGAGFSLTNGSNGQTMESFWQCTGLTDTSTTIQFAWFTDATGLISFDGTTAETGWDENSDGLYMTIVGDPTSVTFTQFSYLSATEFQATFSVSGAGSAPLVCGLYDLNGSPVVASGEQPINDDGPGAGSGSGGTAGAGSNASVTVSMLANDTLVSSGESMWFCALDSGSDMGLYFESSGSGFYFDEDYPDGIDFLWDLNSTLDVSFSTGAYVSLSAPVFSHYNSFSIATMIANGSQDLGGADCSLYDFDGFPL